MVGTPDCGSALIFQAQTEQSTIQEYHPPTPEWVYYRLTQEGKEVLDVITHIIT